MTVRWKPLLILSGLFLVVALVGCRRHHRDAGAAFLAGHPEARPGGPRGRPLRGCRDLLQAGAPGRAPSNAPIHEEFAGLYRDWIRQAAPPRSRPTLRAEWLEPPGRRRSSSTRRPRARGTTAAPATRWTRTWPADSVYWAKELLNVDAGRPRRPLRPGRRGAGGSERRTSRRSSDTSRSWRRGKAPAVRRLWIRARLADLAGDDAARDGGPGRGPGIPAPRGPIPTRSTGSPGSGSRRWRSGPRTDGSRLAGQVEQLREQVKELGKPEDLPPARVGRLRVLLEQTQKVADRSLGQARRPKARRPSTALVDAIEVDLESVFQQALAEGRQPDLQTYLSYADHLRFRHQPDRCLEVIDRALQAAARRRGGPAPHLVMGLHTVAVEMILARAEDAGDSTRRRRTSRPCSTAPTRGPRHSATCSPARSTSTARGSRARSAGRRGRRGAGQTASRRSSATSALEPPQAGRRRRSPTSPRPRPATASRWSCPRSRTSAASTSRTRCGSAAWSPQYQLWAAWTILQAGYPEEAEPIVPVAAPAGRAGQPPARPGGDAPPPPAASSTRPAAVPEDLKKAVEEFDKALAAGQAHDADGDHPAGADRRAARPVRPGPDAARRVAVAGQGGRRRPSSSPS